ncbi:MAG: VOC family protein [Verrucomicrobiota bacterium]
MTCQTEPTVSLSLTVKDASSAIEFYTQAFGAKEVFRMPGPDGGVAHAEFMIGNTQIYISEESKEWHAFAMAKGNTASCLFSIRTEDCGHAFELAVEAGAEPLSQPTYQFWGAQSAVIRDPYGYRWSLIQKVEDLTPDEIMQRAKKLFSA